MSLPMLFITASTLWKLWVSSSVCLCHDILIVAVPLTAATPGLPSALCKNVERKRAVTNALRKGKRIDMASNKKKSEIQ